MIAIVDYGLGNIHAFANIYKRLDIPYFFARTSEDLKLATHIILPGVGAFDYAMERLNASGMRSTLDHLVLETKHPVLGVCVGMQILACKSEEGTSNGLGWIDASVKLFDKSRVQGRTHLPHMGWNNVVPVSNGRLFEDREFSWRFYFLHSYYMEPSNSADILATSDYGISFVSAVNHNNIYGVQFHPEKSHSCGTQLLKNFARL